jgi:hypothetical protein
MSFVVYWIREASHTDMMSQGYIGVSGNVKQRFASHKGMENGTNAHLRHAIEKHGWDNMVKSVLLMAGKDYCLDIERKLRPADKIGWNLTAGGGYPPVNSGARPNLRGRTAWNKGLTGIYSEEVLAKLRSASLGKTPPNKGVPLSLEQKTKLLAANKGNTYRRGKKMPPEIVARINAKNRGRVQSAEERAMRSIAQTGVKKPPLTEEHKRKIGGLAKGKKWYTNGESNVFCLPENKPVEFNLGRLTPWLNGKGE